VDRHSIAQFRTATDFVTHQLATDLSLRRGAGENSAKVATINRVSRLTDDLQTRRQNLGLSVKDVGDRCGIDENSLNEWERGVTAPRLDAVERWAAVLGFHVALAPADAEARRGLRVDWQQRRVAVDGTPMRLTPMEWKALERLARTPGEVVTHQALFHHLYGDERHYRAESTAIRVLITKLRRLLPLRIEAQWGKGYVVSGLDPSLPNPADDGLGAASGNCVHDEPTRLTPTASTPHCELAAPSPNPMPRAPAAAPVRHQVMEIPEPRMTHAAAPPPRHAACRAEELGVIERFLAERGVTRCPDVATIQQSPLPTLVWDKVKRKWVRPSATGRQAS